MRSGSDERLFGLVLADLLVSLGGEKRLKVGRVGELDLAQPACVKSRRSDRGKGVSERDLINMTCLSGPRRLTIAFGLLVEKAWLVVELLVDGLDLARDGCVDVGSSFHLETIARTNRWTRRSIPWPCIRANVDADTYRFDSSDVIFQRRENIASRYMKKARDVSIPFLLQRCIPDRQLTSLLDLSTGFWQLDKDDITERLLSVVGDSYGANVGGIVE